MAIEWREILHFFACPNETRRNSQFVLNRDHDSTFAAAIEFRNDQPRQSNRFMKFARLTQSVATGCRIDHEQRFLRRARIVFREASLHFG